MVMRSECRSRRRREGHLGLGGTHSGSVGKLPSAPVHHSGVPATTGQMCKLKDASLGLKVNGHMNELGETLNAMAQEREQKFLMEASAVARWQAGSAALLQWSQRSGTP